MSGRYRRLSFEVEPGGLELLTATLWEHGTLGIEESSDGRVVAYFADGEGVNLDWSTARARLVESDDCLERDWMAAYRERSRPLEVGRRLIVDPGEPGVGRAGAGGPSGPAGRRLLRLPARTAFGTGSHPSTRLVVELLDDLDLEGAHVLDVGAGSGILSFAAQVFGAGRVVGVEIDLGAALVAAQNRVLNGLFPSFVAGGVGALRSGPGFDLALVNVLPERVAADLETIRDLLRAGGAAIFSGILTESADAVCTRLAAAGFTKSKVRTLDEWSAMSTEVEAR